MNYDSNASLMKDQMKSKMFIMIQKTPNFLDIILFYVDEECKWNKKGCGWLETKGFLASNKRCQRQLDK